MPVISDAGVAMEFKWLYLIRRNPTVSAEDWPRAWRAHAVFASQYPSIGARLNSLYYCSRIYTPTLDSAPFDPPGVTQDYDGVGMLSTTTKKGHEGVVTPEDHAKIYADELRAFATNTFTCCFDAKEVLIHGGKPGGAAIIRFLAHKPGTPREDFFTHLDGPHADVGKRAADSAGAVRYVHNVFTEDPPPGYAFDAYTEMWFATPEDAVRAYAAGKIAPVDRDVATFCDLKTGVTLLSRTIHRWPKT